MQKIIDGTKLDFDDVLIKPKRSELMSRRDVDLFRLFECRGSCDGVISGVPIIAANLDTTGTFAVAKALRKLGCFTALHKFYSIEQLCDFFNDKVESSNAFYSMGVTEQDFEKFREVRNNVNLRHICIDVANGYHQSFVDNIARVRDCCPDSIIMAGNVCTPEMVEEILIHGKADIVKIGIGPGHFCETRRVTGVGFPQLSAILECADAAHGIPGGLICADGGCRNTGDIAKAFGANSDFVMLGSMFAGTEECEGEWYYKYDNSHYYGSYLDTEKQIENYKKGGIKDTLKAYGMSSKEAQEKYHGGVAEHRTSEGNCQLIQYKGNIEEVTKQIFGGLRSACSYVGARTIKDMGKCTTFIRVSRIK